ncbi:hypothetical protein SCHPADRAFT_995225 [Schizopora paradoxa]|uniref:Uncharacterized protein n=1 Tax=Schizopora paradoxa TaxID=27342 RepID=A0A0H2SGN6_9AGAM|nr:hypothetical protein SCHPADRAFT_995225 [Schizopora paradoxa]
MADVDGKSNSKGPSDARGHVCSRPSNNSKELFVSLLSDHQISYEAVERILSGIKSEKFTLEDVKFPVEGILDGSVFDKFPTSTEPDSIAKTRADIGVFLISECINHSEEMLASLVGDELLSVEGFRHILAAASDDAMKTKDLKAETLDTLIFYPLQRRQQVLLEHDHSSSSTPNFPHIVLQALIDSLAAIIIPFYLLVDECIVGIIEKAVNKSYTQSFEARRTLRCLALVHPSWTLTVYRALGRSLYVGRRYYDEVISPWTSKIQNPLYGLWTRELHFYLRKEHSESDKARYTFFIANVSRRFPLLQSVSIILDTINEDFLQCLKTLADLQELENLEIEFTPSDNRMYPFLSYLEENSESMFEVLAQYRRLQTLHMPYWPYRLQEMKFPREFSPLTASREFRTLRLSSPCRTFNQPTFGSNYFNNLIWTRQDGASKDSFGLGILQLEQLPSSFRTLRDVDKNSLTTLHVECTEKVPWNLADHNMECFSSLRDVEFVSKVPFPENVLKSMPLTVESFLIAFPRTMDFFEVDRMLEKHVRRERFPKLKKLRAVRLYFNDKQYTYRRMKISSSIPLTSAACQTRNVEHSAWF